MLNKSVLSDDMAVQFNIKNAEDYLFNVRSPDGTLEEVVESAVREVIGQTNMEPVLTTGRDAVGISTRDSVQEILDGYGTGIQLTAVNLERAQPPEQVQGFSALLKEYQKAPEITRDRLYLEAMESVLSNSSKVLMDAEGGNNLMYLPLDKLIEGGSGNNRSQPGTSSLPSTPPSRGTQLPSRVTDTARDLSRSRSRGTQ